MKHIAGKTPGWDKVEVYLNGVPLPFCIEADDVAGYAIVNIGTVDPDGRIRFQLGADGEIVTRMLFGNVLFVPSKTP